MEADYIIVGAGPAGVVLAARLTEDPDRTVLLLEAGDELVDERARAQGAFFTLWGGPHDWAYTTTPQPGLNGRSIYTPRGKAVGGSSAINVGFWTRGAAADYDLWASLGLPGWNSTTANNVFRRIENSPRAAADPIRGGNGEIVMEPLLTDGPIPDLLLDAFVDAGFGPLGDINSTHPFVATRVETIHKNKYRHTIADDYLTAQVRRRPNLTIVPHAHATRITLDGTTATGIEYTTDGTTRTAIATREVILTAGAINTPHLLMLSGIGPAAHLEEHGIPVAVDLPGVGANLQDHLSVTLNVLAPSGVPVPQYPAADAAALTEWRFDKTGPATYFAGNGIAFFSLTPGATQPEYELIPMYQPTLADDQGNPLFPKVTEERAGYSYAVVLLHPKSTGRITLAGSDPTLAPLIDPGYLSDPGDARALAAGLEAAFALTRTASLAPITEHVHPNPNGDGLEEYVRATASTVFHPVGTAHMGTNNDPNAVLDPQLRVRGIRNLRVADASAFPTLTSGHTMAPTIFIAERAAAILVSEP